MPVGSGAAIFCSSQASAVVQAGAAGVAARTGIAANAASRADTANRQMFGTFTSGVLVQVRPGGHLR
jgi:hypothetical protein